MNRLATAGLYWRTARHLRREQIFGRVRLLTVGRFERPARRSSLPPVRRRQGTLVEPIASRPTLVARDVVELLGERGSISDAGIWNDPARAKLWLYNLHYFHDLTAEAAASRAEWHRNLITRWIDENPLNQGNGWEPYPLSLRIVSWVKWTLAGNELNTTATESLAAQARQLARSIEWHLLGNHLIANAKGLIFAGLWFAGEEGEAWLRIGCSLLARELDEQVLADGAHFELSPMYHASILEDVLDVINLGAVYPGSWGDDFAAQLHAVSASMRRWLAGMTHPDGGIPFFNDAAFGIAASAVEIERYAERLGLARLPRAARSLLRLPVSGYFRLMQDEWCAFFDAAAVGPDYQPGHAHADTLSIEVSIGDERLIVNGGTSEYGTGPERQRQRATAAHSTVEIDGESSSEVWGGFRVARRARVTVLSTIDEARLKSVRACHDGYRRLPGRNQHEREIRLTDGRLVVMDLIAGPTRSAVARFHLGEGVTATIEGSGRGFLRTPGGRSIAWRSTPGARIESATWHPRFGASIATSTLVVPIVDGKAETSFHCQEA